MTRQMRATRAAWLKQAAYSLREVAARVCLIARAPIARARLPRQPLPVAPVGGPKKDLEVEIYSAWKRTHRDLFENGLSIKP